jgi:flagellar hook assembly protein FlgD
MRARAIATAAVIIAVMMLTATGCDEVYYPFETTSGPIDIGYELASSSVVTVLVRNCYLVVVRTLIDSESQASGSHTVNWDLTDDAGDLVENGLYTVEVYGDGIRVDVQLIEVAR